MKPLPLLIALVVLGAGSALLWFLTDPGGGKNPRTTGVALPAELDREPVGATARPDLAASEDVRVSGAPTRTTSGGAVEERSAAPAQQRFDGYALGPQGPVAGAQVVLETSDGQPLDETTSGEDGRFLVATERAEGQVRVVIRARGYAPGASSLRPLGRGSLVMLGNVRLQRASALAGSVTARGAPLVGARVLLVQTDAGAATFERVALTDDDGRFLFTDAPHGRVRVEARADGYGAKLAETVVPPPRSVDLALGPARSLAVRLVDPEGRAVEGLPVELFPEGAAALPRTAATGPDGRARFEGLGIERWMVRSRPADWQPAIRSGVVADGSEVTLELTPWPTLSGRVLAPAGTELPGEGASIELFMSNPGGVAVGGAPIASTTSGAGGRFALVVPRAGIYVARVRARGFARTDSEPVRVGLHAPPEELEVLLRRGVSLVVRLVSGDAPAAGVEVEVHTRPPSELVRWGSIAAAPTAASAAATTDAKGAVRIELLPPGELWLLCRGGELVPHVEGPILVADGGEKAVGPLALERGGRIEGTVRDGEDGVLGGAVLTIRREDRPGSPIRVVADRAGHYASPPLPAGTWVVDARNPRAARHGLTLPAVQLEPGDVRTVDVEF